MDLSPAPNAAKTTTPRGATLTTRPGPPLAFTALLTGILALILLSIAVDSPAQANSPSATASASTCQQAKNAEKRAKTRVKKAKKKLKVAKRKLKKSRARLKVQRTGAARKAVRKAKRTVKQAKKSVKKARRAAARATKARRNACAGSGNDPVSNDRLSAGDGYNFALRADRTIACWGESDRGQASPPSGVFKTVATGYRHSCGIRDDGTVAC